MLQSLPKKKFFSADFGAPIQHCNLIKIIAVLVLLLQNAKAKAENAGAKSPSKFYQKTKEDKRGKERNAKGA
jgi:hypothetical protein